MDVCRYVSFRSFCEMLFSQQLTLKAPLDWNDKYENYVLSVVSNPDSAAELKDQFVKSRNCTEDQAEAFIGFAKKLCSEARCICFSRSIDEEVMWNAYSFGKEAVMWKTTDNKIEQIDPAFDLAVVQYDLEEMGIKGFLGKFINYKGRPAIIDAHKMLTHKRSIFKYENELRVIDFQKKDMPSECYYHIDSLSDFIEGVMVHPLADKRYVNLIKKICEHFNLPFLGQSQIYEMKTIY